jgi:large subunit ribosomal protein L15
MKGQQARSGPGPRPGFEGGQTPLIRRLPRRRGFRNPFRVSFTAVNVGQLARFPAKAEVTPETLQQAGIVDPSDGLIKILGDGELTGPLTVRVHRVSATARSKIEAAGGTVEETLARREKKERKGRAKAKAAQPDEAPQAEGTEEVDDSSDTSGESASAD